MDFQSYRITLETVKTFKYLGWVLTAYDYNWKEVVDNLWKAQIRWAFFSGVWGREGSDPRTSGTLYKAVVQVTLMFRSESWVM